MITFAASGYDLVKKCLILLTRQQEKQNVLYLSVNFVKMAFCKNGGEPTLGPVYLNTVSSLLIYRALAEFPDCHSNFED